MVDMENIITYSKKRIRGFFCPPLFYLSKRPVRIIPLSLTASPNWDTALQPPSRRSIPPFLLIAIVSLVWAFFPQSNAEARSNMPEYMQERYIHFQKSFENSPWPSYMYHKVESVAFCESSLAWYSSGDFNGERFLAIGYMQIRRDYHPRLDNTFNLYNGADNLTAAYIIYLEAGRSWRPWSCKP
tara:strand:- start:4136 stop:4690 length:555 start_codon:yes stop_codon:yes gene_type:complete